MYLCVCVCGRCLYMHVVIIFGGGTYYGCRASSACNFTVGMRGMYEFSLEKNCGVKMDQSMFSGRMPSLE